MSSFTQFSNEVSIRYDAEASKILKGEYWRGLDGFRYCLHYKNSNIYVDVPAGVLSDGATTPRMLWSIIPPWGPYAQAVILHDRLCEVPFITIYKFGREYQEPVTRKEVDKIFFESLRVLGISKPKYYAIRTGVSAYRIFTKASVGNPNPVKRQLELTFDETTKHSLQHAGMLPPSVVS